MLSKQAIRGYKTRLEEIVQNAGRKDPIKELRQVNGTCACDNEFGSLKNEQYQLQAMGEIQMERYELAVQALQRIEDGEYGVCVGCNKKISAQRLDVVPETKYCASCQEKDERSKGH